ncbi:hypothetical protein [Halomicrococcus gelatinilyticus]
MNLPKLTTPDGVFDWLIGLIVLMAAIGALVLAAAATGVIAL